MLAGMPSKRRFVLGARCPMRCRPLKCGLVMPNRYRRTVWRLGVDKESRIDECADERGDAGEQKDPGWMRRPELAWLLPVALLFRWAV